MCHHCLSLCILLSPLTLWPVCQQLSSLSLCQLPQAGLSPSFLSSYQQCPWHVYPKLSPHPAPHVWHAMPKHVISLGRPWVWAPSLLILLFRYSNSVDGEVKMAFGLLMAAQPLALGKTNMPDLNSMQRSYPRAFISWWQPSGGGREKHYKAGNAVVSLPCRWP